MSGDISRKTINEQIDIMQAAAAGAPIAVKAYDSRRWSTTKDPSFNWGTSDYRIDTDYTQLFNLTVGSVNYQELANTLKYIERGKNLRNIVDYSVDTLQDGKTQIESDIRNKFQNEYQSVASDITVESIKNTSVYTTVYNSVKSQYYNRAMGEVNADPSLLSTYGSLEEYFNQVYLASVEADVNAMVVELSNTIKGINDENIVQSVVNIANDAMDSVILQQRNISEDSLYENNADSSEVLQARAESVMGSAIDKYNESLDDSYSFAHDENFSVTIKKQMSEDGPMVNINYSIFNQSVNGDDAPKTDWTITEGKVSTVTGITAEQAQGLLDNTYNNCLNEIKKEEASRKDSNTETLNYVNTNLTKLNNDFTALATSVDGKIDVIAASVANNIESIGKGNYDKLTANELSIKTGNITTLNSNAANVEGTISSGAVQTSSVNSTDNTLQNITSKQIETTSLSAGSITLGVEDLATKLTNLSTTISNIDSAYKSAVSSISEQIDGIVLDTKGNTDSISSINTSISNLQETISKLSNSLDNIIDVVDKHEVRLKLIEHPEQNPYGGETDSRPDHDYGNMGPSYYDSAPDAQHDSGNIDYHP